MTPTFNSHSVQLLYMFWLIFCLIILASYECNLRYYDWLFFDVQY